MVDDGTSVPHRSGGMIAAETIAVIVGTLVLLALGVLVVGIAIDPPTTAPGVPDLGRFLGWRLPVWLLLVVAVEVLARHLTPRGRAGYLVLAAAVAGTITTAVEVLVAAHDPNQGIAIVTFFISGLASIEFMACAAIAAFAVTALFGTRPSLSTRVTAILFALVIVIGAALVAALIPEWLLVYFRLDGPPVVATPAQSARYALTASIGLGALLVGLIGAFATGRRALGVVGVVLLVIGLILAGVLRVPHDDGTPTTPITSSNSDYVPCYSGSGDCPGG